MSQTAGPSVSCDGLRFLARLVDYLSSPPAESEAPLETWIQCDSCFRWRRGVDPASAENVCERRFCQNVGRKCAEPCDHCRGDPCHCTPSQSYNGYSTGGYSLPDGFSVEIRFRRVEGMEIGPPWLSYRAACRTCGRESKGMDRRGYMETWLSEHRGHHAEWSDLSADVFDFRVDHRVREWYGTYVKLHQRGALTKGVEEALQSASSVLSEKEKCDLQSLLQIFNRRPCAEGGNGRMRSRRRPRKRGTGEVAVRHSTRPKGKRRSKQPDWMQREDWVLNERSDEKPVSSVSPVQGEAAEVVVAVEVETSPFARTEKLQSGSLVARRKDKECVIFLGGLMTHPPDGSSKPLKGEDGRRGQSSAATDKEGCPSGRLAEPSAASARAASDYESVLRCTTASHGSVRDADASKK